jgi:hypothetical protein
MTPPDAQPNTEPDDQTVARAASALTATERAAFTHAFNCLCPTCDPGEHPDFIDAARRAIALTERRREWAMTVTDPDEAYRTVAEATTEMFRRLARFHTLRLVWELPDHFLITTTSTPSVRGSGAARFLVTLHDVHDEHGDVVLTLNRSLHGGGEILGGHAVTALDDCRVDPFDATSPVLVGYLRRWFDDDQHGATSFE